MPDSEKQPRCQIEIFDGWRHHKCGRPVKEGDLCGIHLRVRRRKEEAESWEKKRRRKSSDNEKLVTDALEHLSKLGIAARPVYRRYTRAGTYHGAVDAVEIRVDQLMKLLTCARQEG